MAIIYMNSDFFMSTVPNESWFNTYQNTNHFQQTNTQVRKRNTHVHSYTRNSACQNNKTLNKQSKG